VVPGTARGFSAASALTASPLPELWFRGSVNLTLAETLRPVVGVVLPRPRRGHPGQRCDWEQPFWDGDQDALNALLMSEIPKGKVAAWPQYVTDLLMDVEVVDETTLTCLYRGDQARLLHHTGGPKPWRREAWMRVQRNAYVQLLPRLLFEPDVEVRLSPSDLPIWLRPNPLGRALLRALTTSNRAARYVVSHTSGRARDQVMRLRRLLAQPHDG